MPDSISIAIGCDLARFASEFDAIDLRPEDAADVEGLVARLCEEMPPLHMTVDGVHTIVRMDAQTVRDIVERAVGLRP